MNANYVKLMCFLGWKCGIINHEILEGADADNLPRVSRIPDVSVKKINEANYLLFPPPTTVSEHFRISWNPFMNGALT